VESALGMAFAIVTSFFFLFWRGTPGRLNGRDGLPGFLLMLLGVGGWLGYLYLTGHQDYLPDIVMTQLINPVMGEGQSLVWWYYLAALPIIWLPFTLLVLFVNWFAVLGGIPTLWRERKTNGGSSWLWIWLATGVAMLSFMGAKAAFYAVPLLAPLAVLTGRSIIRLTPGRSRGFFALTALVLALSGLATEEDYGVITMVLSGIYEASPFCEKCVLEALCVMGEEDIAIQRMLARYDGMLHDEYDTLWEQFNDDIGTINHGWTAAPLYILSKYVAGIAPVDAGFAKYEIAPADVLDSFSCTVDTPKGAIIVEMSKTDGKTVLTVTAIAAEGIVKIPQTMGTNITVEGGAYEALADGSIKLTEATQYKITIE
jgi:hypothetical protein